jgi:hypothetical protein
VIVSAYLVLQKMRAYEKILLFSITVVIIVALALVAMFTDNVQAFVAGVVAAVSVLLFILILSWRSR